MRGPGGHVKKRGNRWVAIIEFEPDPATGKRRQRQGGSFKTKREAQEALAEMISSQWVAPAKLSLADYLLEDWLPSRSHRSGATRQQYRWAVNHLVEHLGKAKLSRVSPRMVQDLYRDLLDGGLSSTSVQTIGKVLRMALGDAVKRGIIARNPATVVTLPTVHRPEVECWSQEQALAFLNSPQLQENRWRALWRLALATGLRRGELVALRWSDVDVNGCRLFVRQAASLDGYKVSFGPPKTRAAIRAVALDDSTLVDLQTWRVLQRQEHELLGADPELVFTLADGKPIHPQTLTRMWDRIVDATDLEPIHLHAVRHTHATMLLLTGVPLKVVSERLGHSSIQITADTYQHVLDHMQQETAERIGQLLEPKPGSHSRPSDG
jgi:integrase